VRKDIGDYYDEIQRFDEEVGSYMALLKEMAQLDNTVIIVCSDNGWQMPRGLANLYDFGTKIPLIISWPKFFPPGREVDDFINIKDFAPTFLELANILIPEEMNAQSFVDILTSNKQGKIDPKRDHVIMARERHAFVRRGGLGYPGRAIRTADYLYIKNYEPNRWPAGDPPLYGDVDAHMLHYEAPTKIYMLENKDSKQVKPLFDLAFSKRPQHELYNLSEDPFQLNNLAEVNEYKSVLENLSNQLSAYLVKTKDPREVGQIFDWDNAPYFKDRDKKPKPSKKAIQILGLEEEYNYLY
jgi:arylsulfatase A-like enzyme